MIAHAIKIHLLCYGNTCKEIIYSAVGSGGKGKESNKSHIWTMKTPTLSSSQFWQGTSISTSEIAPTRVCNYLSPQLPV